jgi:hypothetical protein
LSAAREKTATPVMDASNELFNDSGLSGYYADKEDEGESFMECNGKKTQPSASIGCQHFVSPHLEV